MLGSKLQFLADASDALGKIYDTISEAKLLKISELIPGHTALIMIDMINGFAREGALHSPRVADLIAQIAALSQKCSDLGIVKLAFADCHSEASPEFQSFPTHCLSGTSESEIVDELKEIGGYTLFPKNSTNGFLEETFQNWLRNHPQIDTFILTGDCTDICIQQFATTLKAWFNKQDLNVRIIVPIDAVQTYDLGLHHGDLTHIMALFTMMGAGIEIVKTIE